MSSERYKPCSQCGKTIDLVEDYPATVVCSHECAVARRSGNSDQSSSGGRLGEWDR